MNRVVFFGVGFFVGVALVVWLTLTAPAVDTGDKEELTLFDRHAYERWLWGLQPLVWDESLAQVARERATWMAATGEFTHQPSNGRSVAIVAEDYGWSTWWKGENLAMSDAGESSYNLMVTFIESAWHRSLVHNPGMSRIGIAQADFGGVRYTAVIFGGQY